MDAFKKKIQDTIRVPNSLNQDQGKRFVGHAWTQKRGMGMGNRHIENNKFYNIYWKQAIGPATPGNSWIPWTLGKL